MECHKHRLVRMKSGSWRCRGQITRQHRLAAEQGPHARLALAGTLAPCGGRRVPEPDARLCAPAKGGMIGEGPSPSCRRNGDCQGHRHPIHRHVAVELLQGAAGPTSSSSALPVHPHLLKQEQREQFQRITTPSSWLLPSAVDRGRGCCNYCVDAEASGMARCTITTSFHRPMTPATPPLPLSPSGRPRVGSRSKVPFPETRQPEMPKS
jgi:hypothetical protein